MKTQRFVLGLIGILFLGGAFVSIFATPLPKTDRWNPRTISENRSYLGVVVRNVPHRFQVRFKLERKFQQFKEFVFSRFFYDRQTTYQPNKHFVFASG